MSIQRTIVELVGSKRPAHKMSCCFPKEVPHYSCWKPKGGDGREGKVGRDAGNVGADGAEDPGRFGAAAWLGGRPAHRADQRRPAGAESGDAVSAAAEAGARSEE